MYKLVLQATVWYYRSIEESNHFSSNLLPPGLFVIHNSLASGQHDVTELTRRQQATNPVLNFVGTNVKTGGDDAALVEPAVELNDNLARPMVVHKLKLANISCN